MELSIFWTEADIWVVILTLRLALSGLQWIKGQREEVNRRG